MSNLGTELLVSLLLVAISVAFHIVGLLGLTRLTRLHIEHLRTPWLTLDRLLVPLAMGTWLFVLAGTEVWEFASAYQLIGATRSWEEALYVSAGSYSTAGWAGAHVPDGWRVLAALEALDGMLLTGWSTAYLFQNLHRILSTEENHPLPAGAIAPESDEEEGKKEEKEEADEQPEAVG